MNTISVVSSLIVKVNNEKWFSFPILVHMLVDRLTTASEREEQILKLSIPPP